MVAKINKKHTDGHWSPVPDKIFTLLIYKCVVHMENYRYACLNHAQFKDLGYAMFKWLIHLIPVIAL